MKWIGNVMKQIGNAVKRIGNAVKCKASSIFLAPAHAHTHTRIPALGRLPAHAHAHTRVPALGHLPAHTRVPALGRLPAHTRVPALGRLPAHTRVPALGRMIALTLALVFPALLALFTLSTLFGLSGLGANAFAEKNDLALYGTDSASIAKERLRLDLDTDDVRRDPNLYHNTEEGGQNGMETLPVRTPRPKEAPSGAGGQGMETASVRTPRPVEASVAGGRENNQIPAPENGNYASGHDVVNAGGNSGGNSGGNAGGNAGGYDAITAGGLNGIVLMATVTEIGVKFDWTPGDAPLGYSIYRSAEQGVEGIAISDFAIYGRQYVDVNVKKDMQYYYNIRKIEAEASLDRETFEFTETVLGPPGEELAVSTADIIMQGAGRQFILMQIGKDTMQVNERIEEIDPGRGTTPLVVENRTLVPIRAIIEAMGGEVGWDDEQQRIRLSAYGHDIIMKLDSVTITVDGEEKEIDVPPKTINDRTMVPVRFVADNVGCNIRWLGTTQEIIIVFYSF